MRDEPVLHGIGGDKVVIHPGHDSLAAPWSKEYTMVLANPPFGKKQSLLFVNEEGETEKEDQVIVREDFWTLTSNKQLISYSISGQLPLVLVRAPHEHRAFRWNCLPARS